MTGIKMVWAKPKLRRIRLTPEMERNVRTQRANQLEAAETPTS